MYTNSPLTEQRMPQKYTAGDYVEYSPRHGESKYSTLGFVQRGLLLTKIYNQWWVRLDDGHNVLWPEQYFTNALIH